MAKESYDLRQPLACSDLLRQDLYTREISKSILEPLVKWERIENKRFSNFTSQFMDIVKDGGKTEAPGIFKS